MRAAAPALAAIACLSRGVPCPGETPRGPAGIESPDDAAYHSALDTLYDGDIDGALREVAALVAAHPEDPLGRYVEALVFCWKVEQGGESTAFDAELRTRIERALASAQAALRKRPDDLRALLARGASHGVDSRYHLFRLHRGEAARAAVRMREDLRELIKRQPTSPDAQFGLGLYDYYADVLPKLAKVVRFLARMPGGDRKRGLRSIESARGGSLLHDVEARIQLYEIYAFYEKKPDRALDEIRGLVHHYREWPLWPLKLAEHLRDRMGLYGESAQVARDVLAMGRSGHANFAGTSLVLARLSLGESLLLDLRASEARTELLPLLGQAAPQDPALLAKAHWLLGRALELEGDREGARGHYRAAAAGADKEIRRGAQEALSSPPSPEELRAVRLIGEARRQREAGHVKEAAELFRRAEGEWPRSAEATLRAAELEIEKGHSVRARIALARLARLEDPDPPWIAAWSRLLLARLHDLDGEREAAIEVYNQVLEEPFGQEELRRAARHGIERPFTPPVDSSALDH